jgi:hypothetical protein
MNHVNIETWELHTRCITGVFLEVPSKRDSMTLNREVLNDQHTTPIGSIGRAAYVIPARLDNLERGTGMAEDSFGTL